jgi:hypothetical protein
MQIPEEVIQEALEKMDEEFKDILAGKAVASGPERYLAEVILRDYDLRRWRLIPKNEPPLLEIERKDSGGKLTFIVRFKHIYYPPADRYLDYLRLIH